MKKIPLSIASIILAGTAFSVAPAHAEDPVWAPMDLPTCVSNLESKQTLYDNVLIQLEIEKANVAQANEVIYQLVRKVNRRGEKIRLLRQKIRKMRFGNDG